MSYLILIILWALFYSTHTFLASLKAKEKIKSSLKSGYKWYRLIYTLFSSVFFFGILIYAATIPAERLLASTDLLTYLGYMFATFGTIIIVKSFKNFSGAKFIGLKPHDDLEENEALVAKGVHAWVRHPIYAGLFLIFLGYLLFAPFLSSLVHLICLIIYLPIGIYFEEKKLITIYGEDYKKYKREVPSIFPYKKPKAV